MWAREDKSRRCFRTLPLLGPGSAPSCEVKGCVLCTQDDGPGGAVWVYHEHHSFFWQGLEDPEGDCDFVSLTALST